MTYATVDDLHALGIKSDALTGMTTSQKEEALEAATGVVDSYVRRTYGTPFPSPVPPELKRAVCAIAAWDLSTSRGFSPSSDQSIQLRYDMTILWLKDVAKGLAQLSSAADATPATQEACPLISSDDPIDWDG